MSISSMPETSDESVPPTTADNEPFGPSWEEDETIGTLLLRSTFALLAGAYLLWAQHRSGISTGAQWSQWIWLSVLCNLAIPLGILWMFFGQGVFRLDWLKDQKHNAWNYGVDFTSWKRHATISLVLFIALFPFLVYFSRQEAVRSFYSSYFPATAGLGPFLLLLLSLVIYMFCWEWFFRGFLLFGMAQGFGPWVSIAVQAALFGAAHWGKPPVEMYSSFAGGLILGVICWREKSFAPAFYTHTLVHIAWVILV